MSPDVLVLSRNVHAMPMADYADRLRERLPDRNVVHARTPAEEAELVGKSTVVTGHAPPDELLDAADAVDLFACTFAGTDHLPLDELESRDVVVTNASGVHGPNVSEHAIAMLLAFAHRLDESRRRQEQNLWQSFPTDELYGSTVTVVGMGAIGTAVLDRLDGFGVETIGVRHSPEKGSPADEVIGYDDEALMDAFVETDHLVLACPLTETTRALVDEAAFHALPPDAVLVNVARGPVVDTDALVSALRANELRGATLDVTDPEPLPPEHPLWDFDNVRITPHNAGQTPAYYERLADVVAENVRRVLGERDDPIENRVI
ncbi:MAG: phosphoglycerate dehydrogenase-like enzyme [Halobacteriales archaeon]|jgi:phosphoglycerate dehydrogenase-like enzyme